MASGISPSTCYRIERQPTNITIPQLLGLANGLQIPARRFFSTGDTDVVGRREDYITAEYIQCHYDSDAVESEIGTGASLKQRDVAKTVDRHWGRIRSTLRADTRLTVEKFLAFCNEFGLDPFNYLIDPNPTAEAKKKLSAATFAAVNAELRALREEMARLRADYALLRDAHNALVRRMDEADAERDTKKRSDPQTRIAPKRYSTLTSPGLMAAEDQDE